MKDSDIIKHLKENMDTMEHISMVLKEHNDMFGLLLNQQKDLIVSLKLIAVSMDSLHLRLVAIEKLNSINKN
jgi:hypothetical protein